MVTVVKPILIACIFFVKVVFIRIILRKYFTMCCKRNINYKNVYAKDNCHPK